MYFKKRSLFFLMLLCCLVLSACGGQESENGTEKVEGLAELGEIQVIAREEGSGTGAHVSGTGYYRPAYPLQGGR